MDIVLLVRDQRRLDGPSPIGFRGWADAGQNVHAGETYLAEVLNAIRY